MFLGSAAVLTEWFLCRLFVAVNNNAYVRIGLPVLATTDKTSSFAGLSLSGLAVRMSLVILTTRSLDVKRGDIGYYGFVSFFRRIHVLYKLNLYRIRCA